MNTAAVVILSIIGAWIVLFFAVFRITRKLHPIPIPWQIAFILENPMRRTFQSPKRHLDRIGVGEGMRVLELGPGPGYFTPEAARRLGEGGELFCLDIEPRLVTRLRRKIMKEELENVALVVGDGQAIPFAEDSFDTAFLVTVLGEIPDKDALLGELRRVLRPDGVLSISELLPDPDYCLKRTTIALGRRAS